MYKKDKENMRNNLRGEKDKGEKIKICNSTSLQKLISSPDFNLIQHFGEDGNRNYLIEHFEHFEHF